MLLTGIRLLVAACQFAAGQFATHQPVLRRLSQFWEALFGTSDAMTSLSVDALLVIACFIFWAYRDACELSMSGLTFGALLLGFAVALALPTVAFVCTAVNLGVCNLMIAMFAMRIAPEALGRITGLTRCLFTLGWCSLPALLVPLRAAASLT